jgi:hypothetical protein
MVKKNLILIIVSPHCLTFVFPCENCFHFLESKEENLIYCSICGFLNIKSEEIRKKLGISMFKLDFKKVRVIQRIVNEKLYMENKMKEFKEKSDKSVIKSQIESLVDSNSIKEDYQVISEKFSSPTFSTSNCKMLKSLYDEEDEELISKLLKFLEISHEFKELKKELHMNEIASQSEINNPLSSIFQNQFLQKKSEWEQKSTQHIPILVEINKHLELLLEQLKEIQHEEFFSENKEIKDGSTKEKIILWRQAFQFISSLIE